MQYTPIETGESYLIDRDGPRRWRWRDSFLHGLLFGMLDQKCVHQLLDNQWAYRKMESASRFSVSKRSVHPLERRSNHSFGPIVGKSKQSENETMGHVFTDFLTTSRDAAKRAMPFDSAHKRGLFIRSYRILIVVWESLSAPVKIDRNSRTGTPFSS